MDPERFDGHATSQCAGTDRRRVLRLLGAAGAAGLAGGLRLGRRPAGGAADGGVLFQDDFAGGFDATGGNWFYFGAPGFVGDDGVETASGAGLRVAAAGTNPRSGEPAFTKTVPQESGPNSLPGGVDHVKWLVYASRFTPDGVPGFRAEPGQELSVSAKVSARTFGTAGHPFGGAVDNPDDDLRLASAALNGIDFASWMVFDVFLTNRRVYAFYERLPFGRPGLGNYAAFSFQVPIAKRRPGDEHEVGIAYDRARGTVRWLLDGEERFRVDRIGHRIARKYMTLDHGGVEETVAPAQLDFGMGLFTLLDGRLPSGRALVRLSNAPDFYFDPEEGEPTPQRFRDEQSRERSRLFGQGAELRVGDVVVASR